MPCDYYSLIEVTFQHFRAKQLLSSLNEMVEASLRLYICVINHVGAHVRIMNECFFALFCQCKHILAVYLCQAMAVTQQESVSDQQMSVLLSGSAAAL